MASFWMDSSAPSPPVRLTFPARSPHFAIRNTSRDSVARCIPASGSSTSNDPLGVPKQVLRYLGRYTHRVAISNHRLVSFDRNQVQFRWRDYRHGNTSRIMTLAADEFIRRFLLHVLPKGFVRIRHFGFMANYRRAASFALCRRLLDAVPVAEPDETTSSDSSWSCPHCQGPMTLLQRFSAHDLAWRFAFQCIPDTS